MKGWPAIAIPIAFLAGCGGGERTFDAPDFVEAVNAKGASLVLGAELPNTQEGVQVHEILLENAGGGSVTVAADENGGFAEYERCEAAVTLLCYRAANVVLILEDELTPEEKERLEAAIRGLANE